MRRLLGRYLALKSKGYKGIVEVSDAESGLDTPSVSVVISGAGVDLQLKIGASISDGLRYFSVNGLTELVIARDGLLEDYSFSTAQVRNPLLLDFLESSSGLNQLSITVGDETTTLKLDQHWELNGALVEEERVKKLLTHASKFRVAEWKDESSQWDFNPSADGSRPSMVTIDHSLRSIQLKIGDKIQRNMAISPTDAPQIVEYRQARIQVDETSRDVLMEEHWLAEFVDLTSGLQTTK